MAYIKYPWHRFQVWLNRQNPRGIAGVRDSTFQNVIARYLEEKLERRVGTTYAHIPNLATSIRPMPKLPLWAGRLVCRLDISEVDSDSYQYRTVKKALEEIKTEAKKSNEFI